MKGKRKLRKLLCMLVCSMAVFGLMSMTALADASDDTITINGVAVTAENASDVLTGKNAGKVSYDAATNTLTINGALMDEEDNRVAVDIKGNGTTNVEIRQYILIPGLTVRGAQDVTVTGMSTAAPMMYDTDIVCCGNVNLTCTGAGYTVAGKLTVDGAQDVTVTSSSSGAPTINENANITCSGNVNLSNTGSGFTVSGNLTVKGAKNVTVESNSGAPTITGNANITCSGDVSISNKGVYAAVYGRLTVDGAQKVTVTCGSTNSELSAVVDELTYKPGEGSNSYTVKAGASLEELSLVKGGNAGETFGPAVLVYHAIQITANTAAISKVNVTVPVPVVGDNPHMPTADGNIKITGSWTKKFGRLTMPLLGTYVFREDDSVNMELTLQTQNGDAFTSDATVIVNGKKATIKSLTDEKIELTVTYTAYPAADDVALTVDTPAVGETFGEPERSAFTYRIESYEWKHGDESVQPEETAAAGNTYRLYVTLAPCKVLSDDLKFINYKFSYKTPVTINGNPATIEEIGTDRIVCFYDFETVAPLTQDEMVKAFVTRMYNQCLSREPDEAGLAGWVEQLTTGQMNGAQIAEAFVFSNEMLTKNLPDEEFIKVLYRAMMGREADATGLAGWMNELANDYSTRSEVTKAFVESAEFTAICESYGIIRGDYQAVGSIERFVAGFYTKCLGRPADAAGHWGWVKQLQNKNLNGAQIAESFFFSEEFVGMNTSNEEYVRRLYRTILSREADEAGLAGWVEQLDNAVLDRKQILAQFIESNEFTGLCEGYGIVRGSL